MALIKNNQYGGVYEFGVAAADAPTINGYVVRQIEFTGQAEVNETATDGEGHIDSRTISKPDQFEKNMTLTGYISSLEDFDALGGTTFNFRGRFFIILTTGEPRQKGKYVEATLTAVSNAGVTS